MKQCPECGREYWDPSLNYCLDDGAALISPGETPTAVLHVPPNEASTRIKFPGRTSEDVPPAATGSHRIGTRVWLITAVALLVIGGAGYLAYIYFSSPTAPKPIDSVAVLPFANKSGDPDSEYLADGLTESLVYRLSQLPELTVSPPSTVMRYKDSSVDPVRAGSELGVSAVVVGKVVERDGNLTVSAELIDIRNNKLLWGEQYDRKMSDLLSTQREIAREIAANLRLKVSGNELGLAKNFTSSNEAYQLYLQARFHWNKRTGPSIQKAIEYLNQAIEKDPRFALAYSGLADCYIVPSSQMAPKDALPKGKAAALRALELDDTLAEAHSSLGRALAIWDWDWAGAEREFKRAIELNPRYPVVHEWYGGYFAAMGKPDAAIKEKEKAVELDPLSLINNFSLAQTLYLAGNYDAAIRTWQKTIELDPNFQATYVYMPAAYAQLGRYDEAVEWFQKMPMKSGADWAYAQGGLGNLYAVTGRDKEALEVIEQLKRASATQYAPAPALALVYTGLGDKDEAFFWLDRAVEERAFQLQWIKVEPRWESLRSDPRFTNIIRRMALP